MKVIRNGMSFGARVSDTRVSFLERENATGGGN